MCPHWAIFCGDDVPPKGYYGVGPPDSPGRVGQGELQLTAVSDFDRHGRRGLIRVGRDSERAFRAATRHSRHVRFLRLAIPGSVAAAVLGGIGFAILAKPLSMLSKIPIDIGSLVMSGSKIMMQQPRISGFTRDNRRYDVTAQSAGQDLSKPDMVELNGIQATMEMQDSAIFETVAKSGLYNSKTEQLTLSQNIVVTSNNGYKAVLSEAVVDIKSGTIVSEQPVEMTSSTWTINANRMEVGDSGQLMRFERGVSVTLLPEVPAPRTTGEVRR
jgi:lipopolysaccharide export system protein LptC